MFITFEGIDGVGKSTQLRLLKDYFLNMGRAVLTLREPGDTKVSEAIRDILLSKENNLDSISELFLFEAARSNLTENVIKPALNEGKIVICDRFYDSTTAYQGYGRKLPLDKIKTCNELATGGLKPDITFLLILNLDKAYKRAGNKNQDRIESSGDDFFNRVIDGFLQIARQEPERVVLIDASDNISSTHELIINKIKELHKL